jgi:5-methylcytosine-specific restriction endonuclease McrA
MSYHFLEEKIEPEKILNNIGLSKEDKITFNGITVTSYSLRFHTFKESLSCFCCGRVGTHFRVQATKNKKGVVNEKGYHLGLWSDDDVQMTKDHILPKSLGGTDELSNFQTLCSICNQKKDNKFINYK